ncbi:MAG: hypothetical protein GY816_19045 [Cytophagales bacterium]|nr:hypothetical protein [Cytophagales bacterium]
MYKVVLVQNFPTIFKIEQITLFGYFGNFGNNSTRNWAFVVLLFLVIPVNLQAQDLDIETIVKENPIKISGSAIFNNRIYSADGIEDRQENYIGTFSARLNMSIYGIAVPLAATITSQNSSVTQPYNRLSLRPKYKWIKTHIGYSSMTFSNYTQSGHTFLGGGVELNPGNIRFAANFGRYATSIPQNRAVNQSFVPSFNRLGGGVKIGYGTEQNYLDIAVFRAKDDKDSWTTIPDSSTVFPGENMAIGLVGKMSLVKNLSISGEFGRSAYTTDVRDDVISNKAAIFSTLGFKSRNSTIIRNALKFSGTYRIGVNSINGAYERIDPEYQTMGTYFFNNDIEIITAGYSTSILNKKMSIVFNGGLQRNNLSGDEVQESKRTIMSGNLVYVINPFSFGLNYSNYSSAIKFVLNSSLDSLNAVIVTQSTGFNTTYALKSVSNRSHLFVLSLYSQKVSDDFSSGDRGKENNMYSGILNYTYKMPEIKTELTARFNYNKNNLDGLVTTRMGPGITLKRLFLNETVTSQLIVNYLNSESGRTTNIILQGAMKINSRHTLMLNVSRIQRSIEMTTQEETTSYGETISSINYGYSF